MIWMENSIFAALVLDRVQYKYSGHMFRKYIVYADLGSRADVAGEWFLAHHNSILYTSYPSFLCYIIPLSFLSFNKTEIEF